MKLFLPFLLLIPLLNLAQEPKPTRVESSLLEASVFKPIKISDQVSLRPGLTVKKGTIFNTFETPIYVDVEITERWSVYLGAHSRTVINSNPMIPKDFVGYFEEPSKTYISIGSEHQFDNSEVDFSIALPLEMNLKFKF